MSAIRNSCVARGALSANGSGPLYTVPAGYVLLMKSVFTRASAPDTPSLSIFVVSDTGAASATIAILKPTDTAPVAWEGWVALNDSDQVYGAVTGGAVSYWISGALLPFAEALPT